MSKRWRLCDITCAGKAVLVACAYSARVAVAYTSGLVRLTSDSPSKQLVNLNVAVYECESTGLYKSRLSTLTYAAIIILFVT
jgi:hypothetical protein